MLLPAAATYTRPESVYVTYHGVLPQHTLDNWSTNAILRIPPLEQVPQEDELVRDDESEHWREEWPSHEEPPRFNTPPPPYTPSPPCTPMRPSTPPPPYKYGDPPPYTYRAAAHMQHIREQIVRPQPQKMGLSRAERYLRRLKQPWHHAGKRVLMD